MARTLEIAYEKYNQRYFSGILPRIRVVWSDVIDADCFGWYMPGNENHEGTILISSELKKTKCLWQMTLLHEMCHVKLREHPEEIRASTYRHSKVWIKEMRRLAAAGAFDRIW